MEDLVPGASKQICYPSFICTQIIEGNYFYLYIFNDA